MADGPYKILVVDDEPDLEPLVLQRMRRAIRAGRYKFLFAQNGVEALELLHQHEDIDMVLSDINMPKMDGLALLEQIPKVDPNIRAVIISAYGDMKNIRTAMNRGAFDFVTKPVDFQDLRVTIERTLSHVAEWREALSSRDKLVVLQEEVVTVEITDDGRSFDPLTEAPEPDLDSSLNERRIGGLGVFFVRSMMDDLQYRREQGKNHLAFTKRRVG